MPSAENSRRAGINDYLKVMLRHKQMIVAVTALSFILALAYAVTADKIYRSTARIHAPQQAQGGMSLLIGQLAGGGAGLAGDLLQAGRPADLYAAILKSEAVKDRIIDRFRLMEEYQGESRLALYRLLSQKVKIEVGKKDPLISISVEDKEPKRAAAMANAYVEELGTLALGLNVSGAAQNKEFLEERLATAKGELSRCEEALKSFQSRNKAIAVPEQARATIEGVAQLRGQLAAQEVQLATYERNLTDYNPEVKSTKAAIANLRGQIARLEGQGGASSIPSVGALPGLGQEYARLMREFKIQEVLVELLTKQYEMSKLTEANNVSMLQVVQKARVPDSKVRPQRLLIVVTCTMAGCAAALFLAFLRDYLAQLPAETRELLAALLSLRSARRDG